MLSRVAPGPAVTLNDAVAVAMAHEPAAGLAMLEPLLDDPGQSVTSRLLAILDSFDVTHPAPVIVGDFPPRRAAPGYHPPTGR
ncbi:hypothetical protein Pa4123_77460 [Phytohabitans aurantiacus]|uniref:Uncharacterized protein n=1 Tax=Phytohabitans aurantiacus TaxID=3016789 RepID=A0ABQ5R7C2_9ACTN|nr:hypothetical protein Pa4123_77460 [Phytohabitans aurantiacus]